jgi:hypothetical protein
MMYDDLEWSHFADVIHTFNRRLNNLLSSCRLYLDHTAGALSAIYGSDSEPLSCYKKSRNEEYDSGFAYRVMEAIRNYAQHRNLPVAHVSVENGEFPGHRTTLNHHLIVPSLDIEELRRDHAFKRSVLQELDSFGKRYMDVRMWVRQYLEALGRIHAEVEHSISADLVAWDAMMSELRGPVRTDLGRTTVVVRHRSVQNSRRRDSYRGLCGRGCGQAPHRSGSQESLRNIVLPPSRLELRRSSRLATFFSRRRCSAREATLTCRSGEGSTPTATSSRSWSQNRNAQSRRANRGGSSGEDRRPPRVSQRTLAPGGEVRSTWHLPV